MAHGWPSDDSALADVLCFCISQADDKTEFENWWLAYRHLVKPLPEPLKARVIAAKDRQKEVIG